MIFAPADHHQRQQPELQKPEQPQKIELQQEPQQQQQQEESPKHQYHHSLPQITKDTLKQQTQTNQANSPLNQKQQSTTSQKQQPHLSKRTSSAAHRDDDDEDVDDFGDFGNFNEYTDNNGHVGMDMIDEGANQPSIIPKGLPTKFMLRGMRGQRQYDVPQIGKFFCFLYFSQFKLFYTEVLVIDA